jgi:hypothetical protein
MSIRQIVPSEKTEETVELLRSRTFLLIILPTVHTVRVYCIYSRMERAWLPRDHLCTL